MFKNILIPTDGSRLSAKGVKAGVKLAKALGAKVTGIYVVIPYMPPVLSDGALYYPGQGPANYMKRAEKEAKKALAEIEVEAQAAGVPYASRIVTDARPWAAIVNTARARKCDAIAMASHGRGGVGSLLLGSETQHVLAKSRIPVLVAR